MFVANYTGTIIRNIRKSADIACKKDGKLTLIIAKSDALGEWKVRPTVKDSQVLLSIVSKNGLSSGVLQFGEGGSGGTHPGELVPMKNGETVPLWIVEEPQDLDLQHFACPSCDMAGLDEDALWYHWAQVHGRDHPEQFVCPICYTKYDNARPQGDPTWGFGNHLFHNHGPPTRRPQAPDVSRKHATYAFSLVIIQHPTTKKFALVEEGAQAGWWLPAGGVDPGEGFIQAAVREAKEEAGIDIEVKAILSFENTPRTKGGGRQRMVFYAQPIDPNQPLKSIPDYESLCCVWISYEELMADLTAKRKQLRGREPVRWFKYVEENGEMHSLSLLSESTFF